MIVDHLQENKSVGAEVNWGVRFKDLQDVGILVHYGSSFSFLFYFLFYFMTE